MIDTKSIRTKILDLAMRGQLTEQLPEDGTAEELYQQIQAEIKNDIKKNKVVDTKYTVPFDIPKNWHTCTFDSINYYISRTTNPLDNRDTNFELYSVPNYPLKRPEIIKGGDIGSSKQLLQENDVLVCKINPRINRVWVVTRFTNYEIIGSSEWIPFRNAHLDTQYLCYYFQSPFFRMHMQSNLSGVGGSLTRAKPEFVKQYPVILPPLTEQHRIVKIIDQAFNALDTVDELQTKYADNLTVLKSKLIDAAIQGKLTKQLPEDGTAEELYQQNQEEKQALIKAGKIKKEKPLPEITENEIPFEIPKSWKWVRLSDLATKISSGNTPTGGRKTDVYVAEGYDFFREQNIYNDGIHREGMVFITEELLNSRPNSTVYPKDILLNITGGSIGRCALIPDNFGRGSINQHILIIRMVDPELRFYIHQVLCSPYAQNYIKNKAVGDKDGFSGGRCKKMLIPLPPLAEQKRIVARLDQALAMIEA